MAAAASVSSAKSRSATASSELAVGRSKASASAVMCRSIGNDVPASARRAERALVEPLAGIGEAAAVARQHLDVSQQMVAEGDGLRRLQMREARHHHIEMRLRLARQRELQGGERRVGGVDPVAHIELEVGRDLVVARARGVQPPGGLADQRLQAALDVHVHVFQRPREGEPPRLDLLQHPVEAGIDLLRVVLGDDALGRQHGGVRLRGADVLGRQSLVEADRGVYLLHDLGRRHREAATPHSVGGLVGHVVATRGCLMRKPERDMLAHNSQPGSARTRPVHGLVGCSRRGNSRICRDIRDAGAS